MNIDLMKLLLHGWKHTIGEPLFTQKKKYNKYDLSM
jgi:hypothetical protein